MRNHSPFTAILGIPAAWPGGARDTVDLSWNVSSHASLEQDADELLLLDGETQTVRLRFGRQFKDRYHIGAEIPWIHHGGGFLDGTIDAWHDITGLNEGIRPSTPRDDLVYAWRVSGRERFRLDDTTSGLGDVALVLGVDAGKWPGRISGRLIAGIELPTGDRDRLTGNERPDYSATVRLARPAAADDAIGWRLELGGTWPGDPGVPDLETSPQIWRYDLLVYAPYRRGFDLLLQVAGHTRAYRSGVKMLGNPAAQVGLGAEWRSGRGFSLRFGFLEDIRAETAPDFSFELGVSARL